MKVLTIAGNELLRFMRTPIALALGLALPLLLTLVTGLGASRAKPSIALVVEDDGPLAAELAESIGGIDDLTVTEYERNDMLNMVARSDVAAGVVIPAGYDQALRSGETADVEYLTAIATDVDASGLINAEVAVLSTRVLAATITADETGLPFDETLAVAQVVVDETPGTEVNLVGPDGGAPDDPVGAFDGPAVSNILLFVFITAVASSAMIMETRQLGVGRRMLATPTGAGTVIGGALLGRFLISAVQAAIIVVVSALFFGVDWGSLPAALAVLAMFALVGAAAGLLAGSVFSSESAAYGVGIGLGIALIYFTQIASLKAFSPHHWAWEALDELMLRRGTVGDILPQLGVLALFAAVLVVLSTWRFRASITG